LKLFQEWREGRMKESDGGVEFNYVRTFVNATMYPSPAQKLKKKKKILI
jgi:hypothetical protein